MRSVGPLKEPQQKRAVSRNEENHPSPHSYLGLQFEPHELPSKGGLGDLDRSYMPVLGRRPTKKKGLQQEQ